MWLALDLMRAMVVLDEGDVSTPPIKDKERCLSSLNSLRLSYCFSGSVGPNFDPRLRRVKENKCSKSVATVRR